MNKIIVLIFLTLLLNACANKHIVEPNNKAESQEISFVTPDNIKIYGDLYTQGKNNPIILLFHQAGSNARGEYGTIIPKLIEKRFNVLSIDQRSGGQYYGKYNRTLAEIPSNVYGDGYGFCDAYNNLKGALEFVVNSGFIGKKIVWGSSYSATLAIQLAAKNQSKIDGVLAFSPASGGSMKNCLPDQYFVKLKKPLLVLRPQSEMENEKSQSQFELAETHGHQTFVAKHGVHGSSMLVKSRVGKDVSETWKAVYKFIESIK